MKTPEIISDLRRRIVKGEFPPGSDLPRRHELLSYYNASVGAFQKCINHLTEEGFLESRGVKGTLVRPYPPHLYRIGIVVPASRSSADFIWDTFWQAFTQAVNARSERDTAYSFSFYYGIEAHSENSSDWHQLVEDIRLHRLAGVIVLEHMRLSDAMQETLQQIPMVLFSERDFSSPNVLPICFDYIGMVERAIKRLKQLGRSRIAVISNTGKFVDFIPEIRQIMERYGMALRPEWVQAACLCPEALPWTAQLVRLLFSPVQRETPDALIVINENLLDYIFPPLAELGLKPGRDLDIVGHSNFPFSSARPLPAERICFDCRRILDTALQVLAEQRGGRTELPRLMARTFWESELK